MASRDPKLLSPLLQSVWTWLYSNTPAVHYGWEIFLTATQRTTGEQKALYAKGRTMPGDKITNCDGVKVVSKHQALPLSKAFDFALRHQGLVVWDDKYFDAIGKDLTDSVFADKIRWGGTFKTKDRPHVEEI
jgi:peptidoglycan L-alanyl-D-glutamate endopeptidase CwlK